ncbi:MAG: hypothetical protein AAGA72_05210 [Pseudomonadota bacterium]
MKLPFLNGSPRAETGYVRPPDPYEPDEPITYRDTSFSAIVARETAKLHAEHREVKAALRRCANAQSNTDVEQAEAHLRSTLQRVAGIASVAEANLENLSNKRRHKAQYVRSLMLAWNDFRPVSSPDAFDTILLAQAFIFVEGGMAAMMLMEGGKFGLWESLGFGVTFAAVNVVLGLVAGFAGRAAFYKRQAHIDLAEDRKIRLAGRMGAGALIALLALLVFAAARTRIVGDANLFDFSKVGFLETFSTAESLQLLTLGVVGGGLAIWKGFCGLSDTRVGFSAARKAAEEDIDNAADKLVEDAFTQIANTCDEALESANTALVTAQDELEDRTEADASLYGRVCKLNNDLEEAQSRLRQLSKRQECGRTFINPDSESSSHALDLSVFDGMKLSEPREGEIASLDPLQERIKALQAAIDASGKARHEAVSEIDAAYVEFMNEAPDLTFLADQQEAF